MTKRLSLATLAALPASVRRPGYDRAAITPGIVHLGLGAFHRAHQAAYIDAALARGARDWGIVAASLRSPDTRDALAPQDSLYTLAVQSGAGLDCRIIGAVTQVVVAPEDPERLLVAMSDPRVRIVSLTITEKGYCHDPATNRLNDAHPDIQHDLKSPTRPRSAAGLIVEALARRRAAGSAPFTVLCCDNLPANGETARSVVAGFAALRDPAFGAFVANEVAFPSTMVDRIVPATTDADRAMIAQALGVEDAWPVVTEPFTQWVVEDHFPTGRPDLAAVGVELVGDVKPYELMKLRMLNGAHSTLAYLGYLSGRETVADAIAEPALAGVVRRVWAEAGTTLPAGAGLDPTAYAARLLERFRNPALKHRTWQIAMDGSQKLPQRLLGSARARLAAGAPIDALALGVAAWMRYVTGIDEKGQPIDVRDPHAARLRTIADAAGPVAERLAPALLAVREVFGDELPKDPRFTGPVSAALGRIYAVGAARAAAEVAIA